MTSFTVSGTFRAGNAPYFRDILHWTRLALVKNGKRDGFALDVVRQVAHPLAIGINHIWASSAPERFYIVGGFARGVGERYLNVLRAEVSQLGLFGFEPAETHAFARRLIVFGKDDDNGGVHGAAIAAVVQDNPGIISRLRLAA
ncbi:hypothetical protein A2291_01000 [candidate division WOR-1 bacterium RIFOXYB2_FULL_42_35]|uniref:ROK family protein n=1 Tax=candidate division WOR-1 bacterium RIFOXYC2_FULL_41_25 TaxID=1802586 RepID=A0A1F4TLN0_UNCSA|nr:MAG: hypothetical protein A2291_01000 [candidate division WOR-1 bacterium RIFOXYB2_FULL_42_35]OGC33596.1 MAG: hypothetical protein A2462_02815 [candidate division WOR-1 bacterium RIFOXYC2_FULL_41_25]